MRWPTHTAGYIAGRYCRVSGCYLRWPARPTGDSVSRSRLVKGGRLRGPACATHGRVARPCLLWSGPLREPAQKAGDITAGSCPPRGGRLHAPAWERGDFVARSCLSQARVFAGARPRRRRFRSRRKPILQARSQGSEPTSGDFAARSRLCLGGRWRAPPMHLVILYPNLVFLGASVCEGPLRQSAIPYLDHV